MSISPSLRSRIYGTLSCIKLLSLAYLTFLGTPSSAVANPLKGTLDRLALHSPSTPLFLSVRTTEGMHSFTFASMRLEDGVEGERHFVGRSRRRAADGSLTKASLSIFHDTGFLYFSSRRRHRPHSIQFALVKSSKGFELDKVRISSAPLLSLSCAVEAHEATQGRDGPAWRASSRAWSRMERFDPPRILEVGAEADYAFFRKFGTQTRNYIRSTLRAADTLYTSELGIRIKLTSLRVTNQGSLQTSTATAENVLETFRRQSRKLRVPTDVRHLFTGKRLDDYTIGLAYVGTACMEEERFNVGISGAVNRALQPVLAAHEMGHNLSAVHDGGKDSIMNPAPRSKHVSFSQTARHDIRSFVESFGNCLETDPGRIR